MASADDDFALLDEDSLTGPGSGETPRHGFRGNRAELHRQFPMALTVAVSREAGSRGSTIAARAGAKLGWTVFNQELLEYMAQENAANKGTDAPQSPEAALWVDAQMERLHRQENLSRHPSVDGLARMVLGLAAQGEAILVGRGAGLVLPHESTLHVRIIAPLLDRVAYIGQWLRLSVKEAGEQVRQRDARRAEFLSTHFHHQSSDLYRYDLVLNSSHLGEETCAELIAEAARAKGRNLFSDPRSESDADLS